MGYIISGNLHKNTTSLFEKEMVKSLANNVIVIDHSCKSNVVFALIEDRRQPAIDGNYPKSILMAKIIKSNGYFAYNMFFEDQEKFYVLTGCPERILSASTNQHPNAVEWREANRKMKEYEDKAKKGKGEMKLGDVYEVYGKKVEYQRHYKGARFVGLSLEKNEVFSYKYSDVNWNKGKLI